jgi:hypothetical protein
MKVCRSCNKEKALNEYYTHAQMADGYLNKCKVCVKTRVNLHRGNNLDAVRDYDKKRNLLPHRVEARRNYTKTENGKIARKQALLNYKHNYPLKYAAHVITTNAVRDGKLIKETSCSKCNSTCKIEGHHNDYTKPLDVTWLCELCHKEWHRHNKPIYV